MSIYRGKRGGNPSQQPLPLKPECRMYVFGKPNGKIALGKGGEMTEECLMLFSLPVLLSQIKYKEERK